MQVLWMHGIFWYKRIFFLKLTACKKMYYCLLALAYCDKKWNTNQLSIMKKIVEWPVNIVLNSIISIILQHVTYVIHGLLKNKPTIKLGQTEHISNNTASVSKSRSKIVIIPNTEKLRALNRS